MTDEELFTKWWNEGGKTNFDTIDKNVQWTRYTFLSALAEGRRLERERCAEMISHIDKIAGPLLAAAIRGKE